jgi:hypothetical protein
MCVDSPIKISHLTLKISYICIYIYSSSKNIINHHYNFLLTLLYLL